MLTRVLPSEFPEVTVAQQPSLKRMFRDHLDMQIEDLRVLLRLPRSDLPAGCNFVAASMIFNLIAGASVCFYKATPRAVKKHPPAGAHFRGILEHYFPWASEQLLPKEGARVLWTYSRNPLAHALGLDRESAPEIQIAKARVGPQRIAALEDSSTRPSWAAPALTRSGSDYVLNVAGLYWGTHRMLHAVLGDPNQRAGQRLWPARWASNSARIVTELGSGARRFDPEPPGVHASGDVGGGL
jgi:hypothetical protein